MLAPYPLEQTALSFSQIVLLEARWCHGMYGSCIEQAKQPDAVLSHARLRVGTQTEMAALYDAALADPAFRSGEFAEFNGQSILWLRLTEDRAIQGHRRWGDLNWIEATPGKDGAVTRIDALVYKVTDMAEGYGHSIDHHLRLGSPSKPGFAIKLQPKSAEDILRRPEAAAAA